MQEYTDLIENHCSLVPNKSIDDIVRGGSNTSIRQQTFFGLNEPDFPLDSDDDKDEFHDRVQILEDELLCLFANEHFLKKRKHHHPDCQTCKKRKAFKHGDRKLFLPILIRMNDSYTPSNIVYGILVILKIPGLIIAIGVRHFGIASEQPMRDSSI